MKAFPWEGAEWYPYWHAKEFLDTGNPNLLACAHLNPGKAAILVVSSFQEADSECKLKVTWLKLGLRWDAVEVKDVITDETVPAADWGLDLPVEGNLWRMVTVRPK